MHYFLFFAALALALPFRTVFAKQLGISATAVGVIFLAVPFFKILTNPLFGLIVDYFKKFKLTIAVLMIIVGLTHVAMVFIPPVKNHSGLKNNFHTSVEYGCDDKILSGSRPFLQVLSKFKAEKDISPSDVLCEIECQKRSTSSLSSETRNGNCEESITGVLQMMLRIRNYQLDVSLANQSFIILQNSTRTLVGAKENWSREFQSESTSRSDDLTINKTSNFTTSGVKYNKGYNYHTFIDKSIFVTEFMEQQRNCPCKERLNCTTTKCNLAVDAQEMNPDSEFLSFQFWSLFVLIAVSSSALCAVIFLVDAVCYEMLSHKKEEYGFQRLWGTIGWGVGALAGGYVNQLTSPDPSNIDYSLSFYLLGLLSLVDLIPVFKLRVDEVQYSSQICKDIWSLLCRIDIAINVIIVFTIGVLSGLIWNYQFWFMEEIGASQVLMGLSQIFEDIFAELPCFLISGWVIRKIGYANCNSLTLLCFGLRYLCFAYMWNPWMTLPVGLLHGPTFGIFFASMTMYGKTEAPPGTEASVQALLAMSFEGIGAGAGSILGGIGFDKIGSRKTFLYSAVASFVLLAINILLHIFILRRKIKAPLPKSPAKELTSEV
ncbi:major facilitator superfamily domain-containing protein 6 [Trichonephila inaurata madagascariensis]|uniref:Major facilitator superfamily domain-containing protein 6 n=1 Tax=Trichonephila inaurata madagascariensis TaxID=2747483 RepID=A0A8X6X848_9ARAC|nr:major facilitator superfamily domain-containing protein 6 [Trichonephila inaurata madagascariensis]